jgi:3-hydroxyisobutyrate dehydrogenase-like beta-hydroxyacid dehydrogenase
MRNLLPRKPRKERSRTIGVIGLGIMGSAMAGNLAKAGFKVQGYDIVARRRTVDAISKIDAPVVITSLPSAEALHAVARELMHRCVVVETSTLPIEDKVSVRDILLKKNIVMLDCPLSGTGAQARVKDLVVYASGDRKGLSKAKPFFPGFSRAHYYVGEFGNGSKMKFVANLMVAIHNVSAAEAFVLGMKAGLAPKDIFKVQANSAGSSRMFQVRGPMMVAGNYDDATMKNEVWQKDMKIIGEFAARLGVATPLFSASAQVYKAAMAQGFALKDTGAVCAVLEKLAGVKREREKPR